MLRYWTIRILHRKLSGISQNILITNVSAINIVAEVLNESGKSVAPIGSIKYICDHNEHKKMKDIVDPTNTWTSLDINMLDSIHLILQ